MSRPDIKRMDKLIGKEIKVLDHGFIRLIDYMGNDAAVVQAARVSYGTGTKTLREDVGLINYLISHRHSSPLEMCEIKLHVKLPIFVARQWIRHRTGSFNEYSGRYSVMDKDFYTPSSENLGLQSTSNNQGREGRLDESVARTSIESIADHSKAAYLLYEDLLHNDVAREIARMVLPVNFYSQWYWKVNLKNLLDFLVLRTDPHAQYEIRVYAEEIEKILRQWLPVVYSAYKNHMKGGVNFSAEAIKVIRSMIAGDTPIEGIDALGKRECRELKKILEGRK